LKSAQFVEKLELARDECWSIKSGWHILILIIVHKTIKSDLI